MKSPESGNGGKKKEQDSVPISARLKDFLLKQRNIFEKYLNILTREEEALAGNDMEALRGLLDMENALNSEIRALQKVINPLEKTFTPAAVDDIDALKSSIEGLKNRVLDMNSKNRAQLVKLMENTALEIKKLRGNFQGKRTYDSSGPSMIDISG